MSKLLAMMMKPKNYMYATIKGSLTENDGVFSGFSASNYLKINQNIVWGNNAEIVCTFTMPSSALTNAMTNLFVGKYSSSARNGFTIYTTGGKSYIYANLNLAGVDTNTYINTVPLELGQTYTAKLIFNGSSYVLELWQNGVKLGEKTISSSSTMSTVSAFYVGSFENANFFTGSIDLNRSYIKLGSTKYNLQAVVGYTIVGSPTIVDGVVSGFSSANYLNLNQIYNAKNIMNTEIYIRAKTPSSFSSGFNYIFSNTSGYNSVFSLAVSSGVAFVSFMGSNLAGTTLAFSDIYISGNPQNNTWYRFKIKGNNGLWVFEVYDDNGNLLGRNTKDWTNLSLDQNYRIKLICLAGVNSGEIDLNETYIKVNNKLWFNGQQA